MLTSKVAEVGTLNGHLEQFLDEMGSWINDCIHDFGSAEPLNIHDQATFTTGWEPYLLTKGEDVQAYSFLTDLRDKISRHFVQTGQWRHGYWTMQEAHHGTEHFELFLGAMHRIQPNDGETIRQIVDAAEHMGNWSEDVQPWFDWDKKLYYSMHFGTDGVLLPTGAELNVPDHLRCINISLLAWQATNEDRYLKLAQVYGQLWAEALLEQLDLPIGIHCKGVIRDITAESNQVYRDFAGELPEDLDKPVNRAENVLASGGMDTFLQLFSLTGERVFRDATEKLLDILATQLHDPDVGAAVHVMRKYRAITGSHRYDQQVLDAVKKNDPFAVNEIALSKPLLRNQQGRPSGVGKRSDMLIWYENSMPRKHSPVLLAFAAEIKQDQALAARAVQFAQVYLNLARRMLPHGREHGCMGTSVSSVARGHGRDNHAGMSTAVFKPIWDMFHR